MSNPPIILASHSRYRRELMDRLGLPYLAIPHRCDEAALKQSRLSPVELASNLARMKAESLRPLHPSALILGSDQVAEVEGEILGKPGSEDAAIAQLLRLSGRSHRLITATVLLSPKSEEDLSAVDIHTLTMRRLSEAALRDYVRRDLPLDCAGSYRIEALGISLFESIEGADYTAIIGLPMLTVVSMLAEVGVEVLGAGPRSMSPE